MGCFHFCRLENKQRNAQAKWATPFYFIIGITATQGMWLKKRQKPNGGRAEGRASVTAAIAWLSHCAAGSACCRRAKQDD